MCIPHVKVHGMMLAKQASWDGKVLIRSTCLFPENKLFNLVVKCKREADGGKD